MKDRATYFKLSNFLQQKIEYFLLSKLGLLYFHLKLVFIYFF